MALDNFDDVPLFCCDDEYADVEDMLGELDLCLLSVLEEVLEEVGDTEVEEDRWFIDVVPISLPIPLLLVLLTLLPPLRPLSPPDLPYSNRVTSK